MKLAILVTGVFVCAAMSNAAFYPLTPLSPFHGLTEMDNADFAYLRQQYARPKRSGSGSGDVLNTLKTSIGQGIKSKLGMIGKASSGHFSPHYYPKEDHKPFDIWGFKKSLLYTLLQAVKAIKGGVIAIKGQLIKGGGQLLTTKGTILKGGGEALSNLGKSIATSAFMIVPHNDYEGEHYEHVAPSSYGHSGPGPEVHHSAPSASGPEYGPPGYHQKYNSVYDGKHEHDGVVILKKIPHGHGEHEGQDTKHETEFKPLKDDTYSGVKHLMGSVFSASSSLTPDHPPLHKPKHHEYPQNEHDYPPHPQPYPPKHYEYPHKDQEHSADVPSTSYGVPAKVIKHPEYYIAPAETINQNQNPNKPQMFVTPSPPTETEVPITYKLEIPKHLSQQHQQKENSQIFIGMHVPLDYQQLTDHSQDYLSEFKLSPTPYSQQIPSKFLINYPDPTELAFPPPSRYISKRAGPRPYKQATKKSPNLEIMRSVAFELRPDSRPLKY